MARPVESIIANPMFAVDPNALDDYGMPNFYGKTVTSAALQSAGVELTQDSRFSDYDATTLQRSGVSKGTKVTGIDANTFLGIDNPSGDQKTFRQTTYSRAGDRFAPTKREMVVDQDFSLGDALKIAAPILLSAIPGVGTGLSAAFGGGFGGTVASRAVLGGLNAGLQGGNIGKGFLSGGLGAGISSLVSPMFGSSVVGRAATGAVTSGAVAKATGSDPFTASVLGAIGGANIGKTVGLDGAAASFVNDLAKITARSQLAQRKKRGG